MNIVKRLLLFGPLGLTTIPIVGVISPTPFGTIEQSSSV